MIESINAPFRQAVRRRGHFPSDQAALKVLYLVIRDRRKNRPNVVGKTAGWKLALQQFACTSATASPTRPNDRTRTDHLHPQGSYTPA
jgi:transposase-like protein